MHNKILKKIHFLKSIPPLEIGSYIFCKINSFLIAFYLKQCGSKFYVAPGSTVRGGDCISVGNDFYAGRGFWIECLKHHNTHLYSPSIIIGDNFSASNYVHITAISNVIIGNNVLVGSNVIIIDHSHGKYSGTVHDSPNIPPIFRDLFYKAKPIRIDDNVWICDNVTILSGVHIGEGAIISANSVIRKDVSKNTIVSGNPARETKVFHNEDKKWVAVLNSQTL